MAWDAEAARARLKAKIAEQDAARGRPLTDAEKLNNLEDALDMERGALRQQPTPRVLTLDEFKDATKDFNPDAVGRNDRSA